jgi:hypothetical protein
MRNDECSSFHPKSDHFKMQRVSMRQSSFLDWNTRPHSKLVTKLLLEQQLPVILATQEAEIKRITVQIQHGK